MPRPSRSPRLRRRDERLLRRAFTDGVARYGEFPLLFARFAEHVVAQLRSRLQRAGEAPSSKIVSRELARAAAADVYLALACDDRLPGAWEAFAGHFLPRVRGLLRQAGAPDQLADEITDSLPGDLIAAPGATGARTRLGTYDGSGSLFGWLAIVALRTLAHGRRERQWSASSDTHGALAPGREDPAAHATSTEAGGQFRRALHAAWQGLTDRERIAVACKYGEGCKQGVIAVLLGVGAPRVSRILGKAVAKIRAEIDAQLGPAAREWESGLREILRDVVGVQLATPGGSPPPAGCESLDHGTTRRR